MDTEYQAGGEAGLVVGTSPLAGLMVGGLLRNAPWLVAQTKRPSLTHALGNSNAYQQKRGCKRGFFNCRSDRLYCRASASPSVHRNAKPCYCAI